MRALLPLRPLLLLSVPIFAALCTAQSPSPVVQDSSQSSLRQPQTAAPAKPLQLRPGRSTSAAPEASTAPTVVMIHNRPYLPPTQHQLFAAYLRDSYGLPAFASSTVRALYGEVRANNPSGYGTDAAGFGQRFGSNVAITAIDGNVRYGMEEVFHEDLRYIPCHGCTVKHKIENALLAEITARHDRDGHRFFTLTPTVSDFSGPLIAHSTWYPGASEGPIKGVVSARTVFAVRIGGHLFREFVLERRHHDAPEPR